MTQYCQLTKACLPFALGLVAADLPFEAPAFDLPFGRSDSSESRSILSHLSALPCPTGHVYSQIIFGD